MSAARVFLACLILGFFMADDPSSGARKVEIPLQIIDTHKLKSPSYLGLLPPEFYPLIGKVVTIWGIFETVFDSLLEALIKANGTSSKPMATSFRKRRSRFREEAALALADMPTILSWCNEMLDTTEKLYVKRNLVAHGHYIFESKHNRDGAPIVSIIVTGRLNGREIKDQFTPDQLDDLYYDLAHLCGKIVAVVTPRQERGMSSSDISKLQAFLSTNLPIPPNLPMLGPRRESSRA